MKPFHALWKKPSDAGVYSGGSWLSSGGFALSNLTTQDVTEPARTTSVAPASTQWRVDLGRDMPLSMFVLLHHNGTETARRRIAVTNSLGVPVYDSGHELMWKPAVPWGSLPFGAFPFSGIDTSVYAGGPLDFHIADKTYFGRWIDMFVSDEDNPAGYFQAGRFMAGAAWQHSMTAVTVKPVDPSEARRTRGGRRIVRRQPSYREMQIDFGQMTEADAYGVGFEIEQQLGKSGDFFAVYDPDDDPSVLFRRAMYCALTDTVGITTTIPAPTPSGRRYSWSINAEELT